MQSKNTYTLTCVDPTSTLTYLKSYKLDGAWKCLMKGSKLRRRDQVNFFESDVVRIINDRGHTIYINSNRFVPEDLYKVHTIEVNI